MGGSIIGPLEKAAILVEALPYIRRFAGKTVVIKYGGHAMVDAALKEAVLQDAVLMKFVGIHPVIVHGGGPEINSWLARLGIESRFVRGQRVTDGPTMEVVEMVLAGKVNKELVAEINRLGGRAVGLSGKDAGLIKAEKETLITGGQERTTKWQEGAKGLVEDRRNRVPKAVETGLSSPPLAGQNRQEASLPGDSPAGGRATAGSCLEKGEAEDGRTFREEDQAIDLGYVGRVAAVNTELLQTVIERGYIPVVAPIGFGAAGETYNINADYVAGALAGALKADKLVLLTDVEGILADPRDKSSLISAIKTAEVPGLIKDGVIGGGMIPKVECCVRALEAGVTQAHIIDGRLPHSILLEVFTDRGIGTMVTW